MAPKRKVAAVIAQPLSYLQEYKKTAAAAESTALVIHEARIDLKSMKTTGKESKVRIKPVDERFILLIKMKSKSGIQAAA